MSTDLPSAPHKAAPQHVPLTDGQQEMVRRLQAASKLHAAEPVGAPCVDDPTFDLRRKQANLCEAVIVRVVPEMWL